MFDIPEIAARWWRESLHKPQFDNGGDGDAAALKMIVALPETLSPQVLNIFEHKLTDAIREALQESDEVALSVDYGPEGLLEQVAEDAALYTGRWNWKTRMIVTATEIRVKRGYGQPYRQLS